MVITDRSSTWFCIGYSQHTNKLWQASYMGNNCVCFHCLLICRLVERSKGEGGVLPFRPFPFRWCFWVFPKSCFEIKLTTELWKCGVVETLSQILKVRYMINYSKRVGRNPY